MLLKLSVATQVWTVPEVLTPLLEQGLLIQGPAFPSCLFSDGVQHSSDQSKVQSF